MATPEIPVIDIEPLLDADGGPEAGSPQHAVGAAISHALQNSGFFYITGHQVPQLLVDALWASAVAFFALPEEEKMKIAMTKGGRAWRGFFPCGGELTSGVPDHKEGEICQQVPSRAS
jgi:isopenicillin N synthase-like dioxygenase